MSELPVVEPPADPQTDGSRIVGILLAAGESVRYGRANKLLAGVDGEPVVVRAVTPLLAAGLADVVAVVGFQAQQIQGAIDDSVSIVVNDAYARGLSTSVAAGVRAARERDADAAVFALGDMPWVSPDSVEALVGAYRAGHGDALAAACEGKRGNPVLFDARHFDALSTLDGDAGGRDILVESDDAALVETGDPGVVRDVDRPGDLDGC